MDFAAYFKVHNLVSVHPKSIILNNHLNAMVTLHISTAWPNLHACAQQGTRRVTAMDSCFVLIRTHQHGIARRKGLM